MKCSGSKPSDPSPLARSRHSISLETARLAGSWPSYRPAVGAGSAAFILFGVSLTVIGPLLQPIREEFATNNATIGLLFLYSSAAHVIGTLAGSYLSDMFGRRLFVVAGPATLALGFLLSGLAPNIQVFLLCGALFGVGFGMLDGPCNALLVDITGPKSARVLNFVHGGFGVGAVFGPIAAAVVYAQTGDWRPVFLGLALAWLLLVIPFFLVAIPGQLPARSAGWQVRRVLSLHLGLLMGVMLCAVAIEMLYQSWLPSYLELERGFERTLAAASLTTVSLGLVLGRAVMGLLAGRWDQYRLLALMMTGCALAAALAMLFRNPLISLAFFGLASMLAAGGFPTAVSLGTANLRSNVGSATGLVVASAGVGGMIFPPVSGVLAEQGQFELVMLLPVPLALLGAGLVWYARGTRRR